MPKGAHNPPNQDHFSFECIFRFLLEAFEYFGRFLRCANGQLISCPEATGYQCPRALFVGLVLLGHHCAMQALVNMALSHDLIASFSSLKIKL